MYKRVVWRSMERRRTQKSISCDLARRCFSHSRFCVHDFQQRLEIGAMFVVWWLKVDGTVTAALEKERDIPISASLIP